ncbi:hypothetical protein KGQ20_09200 [Catenulispora sp. NF23]|uniref:Uncharacterized protein n=1 Tax=Catenulispora pinistramenti TaxID=2705254 RepID=A0ABS5KJW4_9ACTN|nr:hypothetical protein [Catenulispora pinistramenti]MBS2532951.1 hypothetical protein [Catenulispora pinistramenti]MBS2545681.1 hypothetical protein [Catenulispora pinistramenti]
MAVERMNREDFYARLAALDQDGLKKALWNLYWRGAATLRERIEEEINPAPKTSRAKARGEVRSPVAVLGAVERFVRMVESGSYMAGMAGDRSVSRTERSKWRLTFGALAAEARTCLAAPDPRPAEEALELLIGLARAMKDSEYVHSDDPVAAARFVVSDAAAELWASMLRRGGITELITRAMPQLVRWESQYGWTRRGYGATAERERPLARVVAELLPDPDAWIACADAYLAELDRFADPAPSPRWGSPGYLSVSHGGFDHAAFVREQRGNDLAAWHELLLERLPDYDAADRLARIAEHPALASTRSKIVILKTRLALADGNVEQAHTLISAGLEKLPGHQGFYNLAVEIGAELPEAARRVFAERGFAAP